MNTIKICFIGIGSIAKRHIKNIRNICDTKKNIKIIIDAFRRYDEAIEGINKVYTTFEEVPSNYDALFITNPTEMHLDSLLRFHDKAKNFFIEKPVVSISQLEKAKNIVLKENSLYYVACPLRYNSVIQYIKNSIDIESIISVRSISSSYLPDWRPGQDYRKTYSANRELGGGVSIDLIHEWDYLTYLFGWPMQLHCFIGKKSTLDIDSDDLAIYIAEYDNKTIELHLDYFGRKTIREIEIFTREDTIIGDIVSNKVSFLKSGKTIDFQEERDDYQRRELNYFFDMITGKAKKECSFYHGIRVLELTQGIL